MGALVWVVAILAATAPLLVGRGKAAQQSVVVLSFLLSFVCVGFLLLHRHYKRLVPLYDRPAKTAAASAK